MVATVAVQVFKSLNETCVRVLASSWVLMILKGVTSLRILGDKTVRDDGICDSA